MRSKICYIHGLNSSRHSFNFLSQELEHNGDVLIDYASRQPLEQSIQHVLKFIPKKEPVTLIGHSLGGVIALLIAARDYVQVDRIITISSPLGGSKFASFARWVTTGIPLLNDITPMSPHIVELSAATIKAPLLSIISTGGSLPTSTEPNDSVVSVSSQKALKCGKKVEVNANHFEVLLHERTVQHCRKFVLTDG